MIKTVIIAHNYNPGSAATNRIMAYVDGYHHLGFHVVLVLGAEQPFEIPVIPNQVEVLCCIASRSAINREMAKVIKNKYRKGESVIQIYGSPALCLQLPKSRFNIFYECTEIPYLGKRKTIIAFFKESIKRFLAKRATGMLVISRALKQYFQEMGIDNIEVINMFVDLSRFNINVEKHEKYIGYCGFVSVSKDGVDCLIKAFTKFHQIFEDYKLYIIGQFVSEKDRLLLEDIVEKENLNDSVVFTGAIPPSKMPQLLCGARMLALARPNSIQAQFGFPTKLGEYLATGNPVVVTNVGEIHLFMKNMENCILANPNDPNDFSEKMVWVEEHYQEALAIAAEGKKMSASAFSHIKQCEVAIHFMNDIKDDNK